MENLNEGKKKKMSYMAELAEIDKQSAIVAMEAKINKLDEMIEAKNARLNMVNEDENLSELIDKAMELKILFLGSFVLIVVEAIKKHRQERKRQERLNKIKW